MKFTDKTQYTFSPIISIKKQNKNKVKLTEYKIEPYFRQTQLNYREPEILFLNEEQRKLFFIDDLSNFFY